MRRALAIFFALLAVAAPARAQERSITLRDYAVDVVVSRDGTAVVTETIRARFDGTWNGIYRDIALKHETGQGRREKLRIDAVTVTDPQGAGLEFWDEDGDNGARRIRVRVPGASDATRTVVIQYRVLNAIRHFYPGDTPQGGDFDELYWNATGNNWSFPIEHATARIILPDGVYPTRQSAYTGAEGGVGSDADVRVAGNTVTAETRRPLGAGEGLTLAVAFPAGVLPRASLSELRREQRVAWWPLAVPLLTFGLMFRRWRRVGRDPKALPVVVQYAPPEGMSPAELGTVVDNSADLRDVTSTLIDLAVRGYVGIEEVETKQLFGLFTSNEWVFHRRRVDTDGLQAHEQKFLDALFSESDRGPTWESLRARRAAGETIGLDDYGGMASGADAQQYVRMSKLQDRFYQYIPGIKDAIFARLIERGCYLHRPDQARGGWIGFGILIMIVGGIAAGVLGNLGNPLLATVPLAIGALATGASVLVFGSLMAARTEKGARAREAALGFKEFLEKVESDRYRRMITSPELFERFLPHAMAFGVEARWARAFEDLYRQPPDWYAGAHYNSFSTSSFTSNMSAFSSSASSAMSSSPSSSGSSGGGSSGGGSGGGGGGGW